MTIFHRAAKFIMAIVLAVVSLTVGPPAVEIPLTIPDNPAENSALSAISEMTLAQGFDPVKLYYLDLQAYLDAIPGIRSADYYDIALIMGVLQGLVNRDAPHFYIRFSSANHADKVWFDRLTSDEYWRDKIGTEPQFLAGKEVVTLTSPADALYLFKDFYEGYAVWDDGVPATSNAALTACGCDSLLPLRYSERSDSIFANLVNPGSGTIFNYQNKFPQKPVKINLYDQFHTGERFVYGTNNRVLSTGSRKCDAVLWSVYNYLEAGKTNPHLMAYHIDAYYPAKTADGETDYNRGHIYSTAFLLNNDYYIAKKAFFFDLGVMKNENASDDPDQAGKTINSICGSTDYQTMKTVLNAQNERAAAYEYAPITCGGFTAWHIKYTSYINAPGSDKLSNPFQVEWQTVREFSYFNVMLDADAPGLVAMSDASVFMHYPRQERYTQRCDKTSEPDTGEKYNYVMIYMGDYDSAAWLSSQSLAYWDNAERGTLPLAWSFAPGLYDRAPHIIDYMYTTATNNDYFVAGDNGVGYLNPEALQTSLAFGNLKQWTAYNAAVFKQFDLDIQGFLIFDKGANLPHEKLLRKSVYKAYSSFAHQGLLTNMAGGTSCVNGMPVVQMHDCGSAADLASHLNENPEKTGNAFTAARVILKSPSEVANWAEEINTEHPEYKLKIVDPYTFMALYARYR